MSKGLGDIVEEVFEKTGVTKVVETVAGALGIEDCGCAKRRQLLNRLGGKPEVGTEAVVPMYGDPELDKDSPASRRARNAALKAAWEKEHGRPYGTQEETGGTVD